MSRSLIYLCIALASLFLGGCQTQLIDHDDPDLRYYLHLSHTLTDVNPIVDPSAKELDYNQFDMLWLGGDLADNTTVDAASAAEVAEVFKLDNPDTFLSIGNHDYTQPELMKSYTQRAHYYSSHRDGLTIVVLDTEANSSKIVGAQLRFLQEVLDTIQVSSHLVILHHKLMWLMDHSDLENRAANISNGPINLTADSCIFCLNLNNFYADIYPKLLEVKERDINVLLVGGDIGDFVTEFEYLTDEGIQYLASGISSDSLVKKALLFEHNIAKQQLTWEYVSLDKL